jgi:Calcineurin-like phosphoesterase
VARSRRGDRSALAGGFLVVLVGVAQAAGAPPPAGVPGPPVHAIARSLFLIGDAGKPAKGEEPVLVALRRDVAPLASRATVVFLGDNVYPRGLPPETDPDRPEMERRLDDQVDAARPFGAHVVFIPGNHDWAGGRSGGWASVRREQQRVEERGGPAVEFLPKDACPGPEVVDEGQQLRLVALDTQWWLQSHQEPQGTTTTCAADSEEEVTEALRAALEQAGRRAVVVVMHHPLVSGGPHGGRFGLKQHLFPLTEVKKWAWLPLPLIGSAYPIARSQGISSQDQGSGAYRRMRDALVGAARGHPPLAWASGHEHVLEVIERRQLGRVLVSGAGIVGHASYVRDVDGARFAAGQAGYMRIDFLDDGRRRLSVVEVAKDASSREVYSEPLP